MNRLYELCDRLDLEMRVMRFPNRETSITWQICFLSSGTDQIDIDYGVHFGGSEFVAKLKAENHLEKMNNI